MAVWRRSNRFTDIALPNKLNIMASSPTKPSADQYEQANYWVSLLHDGDCAQEQHQEFQAWLFNQQAYQEVEAYWQELGGLETLAQPQMDAARPYSRLAQKRHWLPRQF